MVIYTKYFFILNFQLNNSELGTAQPHLVYNFSRFTIFQYLNFLELKFSEIRMFFVTTNLLGDKIFQDLKYSYINLSKLKERVYRFLLQGRRKGWCQGCRKYVCVWYPNFFTTKVSYEVRDCFFHIMGQKKLRLF